MNKYSFSEFVSTAYSLILTKIFYPKARLIRRPVYIRGKKSFLGGSKITLGHSCRFDLPGDRQTLYIGENCEFGDNTHIVAHNKVSIGNDILIASKVFISDTSHGSYKGNNQDTPFSKPNDRKLVSGVVSIGNNVWIGENAVIMAGADIHDGCIIGANSVITKEIPENSIVIGNNKIVKCYSVENKEWVKVKQNDISMSGDI